VAPERTTANRLCFASCGISPTLVELRKDTQRRAESINVEAEGSAYVNKIV